MAAFEYQAVDQRGRNKKGMAEGDTERQVRSQLRERGLVPLNVRLVASKQGTGRSTLFQRGFSTSDLSLFTRQLATLVRSGLPLEEALSAVSEQTESARVRRTALGVRTKIIEGDSLAAALNDHPATFNELFRATVRAGEQSGHLDEILDRLADYVEARQAMRQKVVLASVYPAILSLVAIGVVMLLLTFVVPQVVDVFSSLNEELPPLTRGLIATSDFLRGNFLILILLLVATGIAWTLLMRRPAFTYRVHAVRLKLPLVGRLIRGINTARFTRTLSILSGAGVPVLDALNISEQVVSNKPMSKAIGVTARKVREGGSISRALGQSKLFPPIAVHLIASGEQSGQLDDMLQRAAENQENEVQARISTVLGVFEPLLILTMGGFVLMIVLAILMPIFNLNELVQ